MFIVILELSFVIILEFYYFLSVCFLELKRGKKGREASLLSMNSFHHFFICLVISKLVPLCYFQRTNTYFPVVTGEVAWLFWGWGIGSFVKLYRFTSNICFQLLRIMASNSGAIQGFWGPRQLAYICFSQYRQKCCFCFLLFEIISKWGSNQKCFLFFLPRYIVFRGPRS